MKILLGIVGQYRTFEKTYKNIYDNLINNNSSHDFEIVLNTDYTNKDIIDPNNKKKTNIYYEKDELLEKFNNFYGKHLKQTIDYNVSDNDINNGAFQIFKKRISIICENIKEKYDLYIFIRFDVIFQNKVDINKYINNSFNFICRELSHDTRIDHHRDWDLCWIFNKIKYFNFFCNKFGNYTLYKNELTLKELLDFSDKINFKTGYIKQVKKDNKIIESWVKTFWIIFYNMYHSKCNIYFDEEVLVEIIR